MTSKDEWLDTGLVVLAQDGIAAVTIEALCARTGRSKGSFYHHFANMPAYRDRLLERFEARETQAFIDLVDTLPDDDAGAKVEALVAAVVAAGDGRRELETMVRAWANQDPLARAFVERIDERRIAFLTDLYETLGKDARRSEEYARITYLLLIGANHVLPPVPPEGQGALWRVLIEALGREPEG